MQININTDHIDRHFKKAHRYLPVRLSTTTFDNYGECIVIVANRADEMLTDIVENDKSEVFITLMDEQLYEDIKTRIWEMDYWSPQKHYNTYDGRADGCLKKFHLDGMVF